MSAHALPRVGDPVPWWIGHTDANPRFVIGSVAGRYVLLGFLGSAAQPVVAQALAALSTAPLPDSGHAVGFLLSIDPTDREQSRIPQRPPVLRAVWDEDAAISRQYGVVREGASGTEYQPCWMLLDPQLRVLEVAPINALAPLLARLQALPPPGLHAGNAVPAPVLVLPRVFEPALCRALIEEYDRQGGEQSGFMREVNGRTVLMHDTGHKVRRDVMLEDGPLKEAVQNRIRTRVVPEIHRAFQFTATRMERYLVACYDAAEGGHFSAHRDNTTKGTAHRRFAVTINLNAEDFSGGGLRFPEFGPAEYKAPTGGAVVFSCSLLHQAMPVTAGRRYAFLPFLYDEAAAKIREQNLKFVGAPAEAG
jgi:predicted 2-oxoglutarate/Fe(II)-dependent dioxygenase YbiX